MLETFNGLFVEIPTKDADGNNAWNYRKIPIKYKSREKLNLFDEVEEQNLLSGNYNVLPRTSLALTSTIKNQERQSGKFTKIATSDFGEFLYNAVSYDFAYDMAVMCRGMNEASNVVEQIASKFNPNYTILINEIPNQITPTSVPIQLVEISMEDQEYEEISTNIVTVNVSMVLKGNFYMPVRDMKKVKHFKMYMNLWYNDIENEMNRAELFDFDVNDGIVEDIPDQEELIIDGEFGKISPVIDDIITTVDSNLTDSVSVGTEMNVTCVVHDFDNKYDELTYIWDVSGSGTITQDDSEISDGSRQILIGSASEIVELKCIVQDVHGNSSNLFIKQITIV